MKPLALVVADFRGRNFENIFRQDCFVGKDNFSSINFIAIPGARIQTLLEPTLSFLSRVDHSTTVLIKLAVGINNFTKKTKNSYNEIEIHLDSYHVNEIYSQFVQFVNTVKKAHSNSVVTVCGIPPANLVTIQQHYMKLRKLKQPSLKEEVLKLKTDLLMVDVELLNRKIFGLNQNTQCNIVPHTASLDTYVVKRKSNGNSRYLVQSLPDGLHGSDRVQLNWIQCIWKSLLKEDIKLTERGLPIGWEARSESKR